MGRGEYEVFPTQLYFYRVLEKEKTGEYEDDWGKGGNGIYYEKDRKKENNNTVVQGEYLLDAVWLERDGSQQDEQGHKYKYQGKLALGCECEWGWNWDLEKGSNKDYLDYFAEDFMKLVHVQAKLKVMFFTYGAEGQPGNLESILDLAEELARYDKNGQYLLIGLR